MKVDVKIAFICTVLNEENGIHSLLNNLLSQVVKPDEIIIVDGGSSDRTLSILNSYKKKHPFIKLIEAPNTNIAEGRNIAIRQASSEIIIVTDAGCKPDMNWVEEITKPLYEDALVYAVSGKIIPEPINKFEFFSGLLSLPDHSTKGQKTLFYGRCSAFRRKLWQTTGGYPEWLYTAEDSLFSLSAQQQGYKIVHNSKATIHWRPRPTLSKLAKMFFLYGRGNGRINWGDLHGTLYWLRYYGLLFLTFVLGFFYPIVWIASSFIVAFLYFSIALPNLKNIRKLSTDWSREWHIPLITITRNFFSNLGFLVGHFEYIKNPMFKKNLDQYLKK